MVQTLRPEMALVKKQMQFCLKRLVVLCTLLEVNNAALG